MPNPAVVLVRASKAPRIKQASVGLPERQKPLPNGDGQTLVAPPDDVEGPVRLQAGAAELPKAAVINGVRLCSRWTLALRKL